MPTAKEIYAKLMETHDALAAPVPLTASARTTLARIVAKASPDRAAQIRAGGSPHITVDEALAAMQAD